MINLSRQRIAIYFYLLIVFTLVFGLSFNVEGEKITGYFVFENIKNIFNNDKDKITGAVTEVEFGGNKYRVDLPNGKVSDGDEEISGALRLKVLAEAGFFRNGKYNKDGDEKNALVDPITHIVYIKKGNERNCSYRS